MKLRIKVKTSQRHEAIILKDGLLMVSVKAQPVGGQANKRVIEFIAKEIGIQKTSIKLTLGTGSCYKTLELDDTNKVKITKYFNEVGLINEH